MLRALKTITFLYVPQEDRIAGAINAGHPDAWSCWLTRRLALAVLERARGLHRQYVDSGGDPVPGFAVQFDQRLLKKLSIRLQA